MKRTKFNAERPLGTLVAYLITNTVNGKKYVGITHNPTTRKRRHLRCKYNTCRLLREAVEKYGKDAFTFEIVGCSRTWENLLIFEEELIAHHDTFAPAGKGYNLTLGGQGALGYKHSEETKAKMRGRVVSVETREIMRQQRLGRMPTNIKKLVAGLTGRPCSEETRRRIAEAQKGKIISEESRKRMRQARVGKGSARARSVKTPEGIFPSAKAAAIHYGIHPMSGVYRANMNKDGWSWVDSSTRIAHGARNPKTLTDI